MSNEYYAKLALRELGITHPSAELIQNWIRAQEAASVEADDNDAAPPFEALAAIKPLKPSQPFPPNNPRTYPRSDGQPHGTSNSNLEPLLREQGRQLGEPVMIKKAGRPGRPQIRAIWFEKVAETMADGTTLRDALEIHGLQPLTSAQMRALYRNTYFKSLVQKARQEYEAHMEEAIAAWKEKRVAA